MFDIVDFPGVQLPGLNIGEIARGYGCEAVLVEKAADLASALIQSFTSKGPVVLDVLLDPTVAVLY